MIKRFLLILCAALFVAGTALADEGMWLYNNLPPSVKQQMKKKYGFEPTQAWLDHLRLSSVRLGASASFVSPDGLIFTNHHVGAGCIHEVSTNEKDYMKVGFYAQTKEQEPKCPNMEASILTDIQDVTPKVTAGVQPNMSAVEAAAAQRNAITQIEKECTDEKARTRCQVVTLYSGALYHLYKYKRYTDVRLVFAPEYDTAFFGGDPDNFTYPRYDLDITFLRAYENGKPVKAENYLKWSKTGVKEGDLIFVSGNPGSTARLNTVAQMEFLRDVAYPYSLKSAARSLEILNKYSAQSPENARLVERQIFGLANSRKATEGYQSGLLDKVLFAKKVAEEKALRAAVAGDPKKKAEFGDPWTEIEEAIKTEREIYFRNMFIEGMGGGRGSGLMASARTLVRVAAEKQKPSNERLPGFTDNALPMLERRIGSNQQPVHKDLEQLMLANSLTEMQEQVGANDPTVQKILGGKTPEDAAKFLVEGTKLDDPAFRKELYAGGQAAIDASTDPMIVVMKLHRRRRPRSAQGDGRRGHLGGTQERRRDRQGHLRAEGPEHSSGRDRHAAPQLWRGEGLYREREEDPALHHHGRNLRLRGAARQQSSIQADRQLDQCQVEDQPQDPVQLRFHRGHHRRQLRKPGGEQEGGNRGHHLRREPAGQSLAVHV